MYAAPATQRIEEPPVSGRIDQRSHPRYPIALELQYKVLREGRTEHIGVGQTVNISSGGVLFEASDLPHEQGMIELAMNWPFLLDEVCNLKLVMRGHIVRRDHGRLAVRAVQHEFRTAGVMSRMVHPSTDRGAS